MGQVSYHSRIFDSLLDEALKASGAVLIEGPKGCGKTRTATQHAQSILYLQDQGQAKKYIRIAQMLPSILLQGAEPRLLDEWQVAPMLWDAVNFSVEQQGGFGQYILTGSAMPPEASGDSLRRHAGTDRITRLRMRPMSLWETGESTGEVSLSSLFENSGNMEVKGTSRLTIPELAYCICRGGWPEAFAKERRSALRVAVNYVKVIAAQLLRFDGVERNPNRVTLLLRSLARNVSTLTKQDTLIQDLQANGCTATDKTVADYLNALRQIFVVEDVPAWTPQMRSKTAIRTSAKCQFVDPSIAAASLRTTSESLLHDFNTFDVLFESLCTRDLRVYCQKFDGQVSHFRNRLGLKADLIVTCPNLQWAPIEVTLGASEIPKAQANLDALLNKVDIGKVGPPAFRMILTGTEYAYQLADGTIVCPIGCLGP